MQQRFLNLLIITFLKPTLTSFFNFENQLQGFDGYKNLFIDFTYRQPIAHVVLKIHRKYIGQLEMKKKYIGYKKCQILFIMLHQVKCIKIVGKLTLNETLIKPHSYQTYMRGWKNNLKVDISLNGFVHGRKGSKYQYNLWFYPTAQ